MHYFPLAIHLRGVNATQRMLHYSKRSDNMHVYYELMFYHHVALRLSNARQTKHKRTHTLAHAHTYRY